MHEGGTRLLPLFPHLLLLLPVAAYPKTGFIMILQLVLVSFMGQKQTQGGLFCISGLCSPNKKILYGKLVETTL